MNFTNVIERGPRDYVRLPGTIPENWVVADIGPGNYPFLRANLFIDWDSRVLDGLALEPHQTTLHDTFTNGLEHIPDKYIDYVWCSHVLEHVEDPEQAARILSRIAKRGTIVMPSVFKESLNDFEERTHRWFVLPHPQSGKAPIFVAHNPVYMQRITDIEIQKATARLYRLEMSHECRDAEILHEWFFKTEPNLDVVYHWEDELKLTVIR